MRIAVVGSRHFTDYAYVKNILDYYLAANEIDAIITGDAAGADTLAAKYAKKNDILCKRHVANWEKHGKAAGPIRNGFVVEECHMMIAFRIEGEENRGTNNAIKQAREKGKEIVVCDYTPKDDIEDIGC